ncbi:MAG TPA: 23S rRNA (adenine(2030)-N(6))-methyltransferase RlmJ, partial [Acidiphilium sp.]
AWYPVKHRRPVREFFTDLAARGIPDMIACELLLRPALDPAKLNGSGLLIVNPPYGFETEAAPILTALRTTLADADGDATITRLADE